MSKVYLEKVQKAHMLVAGMRKNYELIKDLGITSEQIDLLERNASEAAVYNEELEKLREEVSAKVSCANKKMDEIKEIVTMAKKLIKRKFDQTEWRNFGIADKR